MVDTDRTLPHSKTVKRLPYEQKFKLEYSIELKFIWKSHAAKVTHFVHCVKAANRRVFCKYAVLTVSYHFWTQSLLIRV